MNLMTIIAQFSQKIGLKNIFLILSYVLSFCAGAYCCYLHYSLELEEYKAETEKQKNQLLQTAAKTEKEARDRIANIERENLEVQNKLKADYENTISNLRDNYTIANSVQCDSSRSSNSVSRKAEHTDKLRCYTENELYRQIEKSLAITAECDRLAADYNALLKVCKGL